MVLREKRNLMNSPQFAGVFLRSSKSHAERVMEQNFKTLLDALPVGTDYMMTANGKMIRKDSTRQNRYRPGQQANVMRSPRSNRGQDGLSLGQHSALLSEPNFCSLEHKWLDWQKEKCFRHYSNKNKQ
jgi:hypothetical protein